MLKLVSFFNMVTSWNESARNVVYIVELAHFQLLTDGIFLHDENGSFNQPDSTALKKWPKGENGLTCWCKFGGLIPGKNKIDFCIQ